MLRYAVVVFASLLLGPGAGFANATGEALHHSLAQRHGWMARDANPKHAWLYVAGYRDKVDILDLDHFSGTVIGSISQGVSGPGGIALDAQGNLYVANQTAPDVTVYAPGATSPTMTLTGIENPQGVAVNTAGYVYVCNRASNPGIYVFPPGQTKPSEHITSPLLEIPNQVVFDDAGNLYIADDNTGIAVLPPGSSSSVTSLGLKHLGGSPSGLTVNARTGALYVSNAELNNDRVRLYRPNHQRPKRVVDLPYGAVNFLGSGVLNGHYLVFAPDFDSTELYIFDRSLKSSPIQLSLPFSLVNGTAFKRPGLP